MFNETTILQRTDGSLVFLYQIISFLSFTPRFTFVRVTVSRSNSIVGSYLLACTRIFIECSVLFMYTVCR